MKKSILTVIFAVSLLMFLWFLANVEFIEDNTWRGLRSIVDIL